MRLFKASERPVEAVKLDCQPTEMVGIFPNTLEASQSLLESSIERCSSFYSSWTQ